MSISPAKDADGRPDPPPEPLAEPLAEPVVSATPGPGPGLGSGAGCGASAAAFFDVDNTIIRGASGYHLARELYRREFFSIVDIAIFVGHAIGYFLFGENNQQIDRARSRAQGVIRGHSVAEMISIAEQVYDEALASKVFPGTRALLDRHLAAGDQVWLITASPLEIGELVARRLGATGALGSVAERRDGIYTGGLVGDLMHGEAKAAAARMIAEREGLDLADCYAYGDSVNDIPILTAVGHPCAINPEPRLRLHCRDAGWPVRDFRRKRSSMRVKIGGTAGGAGAVWALAIVVRSIRRRIAERILH